ncbi:hypothetical protein NM208_g16913 [Fusarium decemcellulare]|uniref:Uncharacterized protein n=1 Tax=Fusarium decemcellulare TaxID=57161 RepID=A0ACC1RCZ4_9HYPO|nr:hypothetical protein NM208_g16913 [Fusarium decemcellulare]
MVTWMDRLSLVAQPYQTHVISPIALRYSPRTGANSFLGQLGSITTAITTTKMRTYTSHHPLTDEQSRLLNVMMNLSWDMTSPYDQAGIRELCIAYPDIGKTAQVDSESSLASIVPLSQRSHLPDNYSEVTTEAAYDAFEKTRPQWLSESMYQSSSLVAVDHG